MARRWGRRLLAAVPMFLVVNAVAAAFAMPVAAAGRLAFSPAPPQTASENDRGADGFYIQLGEISDDTAAGPWTASVSWGDGTASSLKTSPGPLWMSHAYPVANAMRQYAIDVRIENGWAETATGRTTFAISASTLPRLTPPATVTLTNADADSAGEYLVNLGTLSDSGGQPAGPWSVTLLWTDVKPAGIGFEVPTLGPVTQRIPFVRTGAVSDYEVTVWVQNAAGFQSSTSFHVTLTDAPPAIFVRPYLQSTETFEGRSVDSWAEFDAGTLAGPFTCTVQYDSGAPAEGTIDGDRCTGPSILAIPGSRPVVFTVTDGSHVTQSTTTLTGENFVTVVWYPIVSGTLRAGEPVVASAEFRDDGYAVETYTCGVDYGDGTPPVPGTVSGLVCTGDPHAYVAAGTYDVVVTIDDGTIRTASNATSIVVDAAEPPLPAPPSLHLNAVVDVPEGPAAPVTLGTYADGLAPLHVSVTDGAGFSYEYDPSDASVVAPIGSSLAGRTLTVTLTDSAGRSTSGTIQVQATNEPPVIEEVGTWPLMEGEPGYAIVRFSDPGLDAGETYTCEVDYGQGAGFELGTLEAAAPYICDGPAHVYAAVGAQTLRVRITDSNGGVAEKSVTFDVANVVPAVTDVRTTDAARVGVRVTMSVSYYDHGAGETYTATWDWGDGTRTTKIVPGGDQTVSASHAYARPGMKTPQVRVSDGRQPVAWYVGGTIAIWDPNAGGVSGKGTMDAPADACVMNEECGVASITSLSVSAAYAKGATVPTVSMTYSAPRFSFKATSGTWIVVSGHTAVLRGKGTVNGSGQYTFELTVVDGVRDSVKLLINDEATGWAVYGLETSPLRSGGMQVR